VSLQHITDPNPYVNHRTNQTQASMPGPEPDSVMEELAKQIGEGARALARACL
jgi:hypothetical protein